MWFVPLAAGQEPYRFLTSAFVHSQNNMLHWALTMYALWIVGPFLEAMLGRARYLALYILAALGGSTAVLLLANSPEELITPAVGASGAIFGLFAAVLIVMRRVGREATQIFIVIALNSVIGWVVPAISRSEERRVGRGGGDRRGQDGGERRGRAGTDGLVACERVTVLRSVCCMLSLLFCKQRTPSEMPT